MTKSVHYKHHHELPRDEGNLHALYLVHDTLSSVLLSQPVRIWDLVVSSADQILTQNIRHYGRQNEAIYLLIYDTDHEGCSSEEYETGVSKRSLEKSFFRARLSLVLFFVDILTFELLTPEEQIRKIS
jgi:hypothetical protein